MIHRIEVKKTDFRLNIFRLYDFDILKGLFHFIVRQQGMNAWIAGGTARYLLSKNTWCSLPDDIDVWMEFDIGNDSIVEEILKPVFPSEIVSKIKIYRTASEVKTFSSIIHIICQPWAPNIQIMCNSNFPIQDILQEFDFTICRVAIQAKSYIYKDEKVIDPATFNVLYDEKFFDDEKNNRLRLPLNIQTNQLWRIYKYYCKGYHLEFEDAVKMIGFLQESANIDSKIIHVILKNFRENSNDFFIAPILKKLYEEFLQKMSQKV